MSNIIKSTPRLSSIEMEACFIQAASTQGIPMEELRRSTSLPVSFFYEVLLLASDRMIRAELTQVLGILEVSNHQIRDKLARVDTPTPTGTIRPAGSPPPEINPREMRLIQAALKDRSDAVRQRLTHLDEALAKA